MRFKLAKGKVEIPLPKKNPTDPYILAYSASLHLMVRAKYLFFSTIAECNKKNTYSSFVLVRAFFETCMALAYLAIKLEKKGDAGDLEGIWKLAHRILQGGKHFPDRTFLEKVKKEDVPAINIYDYIDEVDSEYTKIKKPTDKSTSPHREMYDAVLSEFGHPNYLGLITCSKLYEDSKGQFRETVYLNKSYNKGDKKGCFIYLDWGALILFHYWDKLHELFNKVGLDLVKLKKSRSFKWHLHWILNTNTIIGSFLFFTIFSNDILHVWKIQRLFCCLVQVQVAVQEEQIVSHHLGISYLKNLLKISQILGELK